MSDTPDYTRKVQLGATGDMTVVQDDPENLKVEIHQPATKESFKVIQAVAANLKATVTQSSALRSVINAIAANLKVEIHQPTAKETFEVIQAVAASLKATVTQAAKDRTVTCNTAANLKAEITPAAAAEFLNYPRIPTGATQVAVSGTIKEDELILHTVTTGKTFYLTHFTFLAHSSATAVTAYLIVRNAADVDQYSIVDVRFDAVGAVPFSGTFVSPLEIPSLYDIYIKTNAGTVDARAFIHGYEA